MKKIKFAFLALLTAGTTGIFAQERGHSFSPNQKGYYNLRTLFTGDDLSLEANGAASRDMNGAAFMSSQRGASGTMWQFVADNSQPGWYRLKSQSQGNNKCLDANGKDRVHLHGGAVFMENCNYSSGQFWKLELVSSANSDHIYRLRAMSFGVTQSLEGNKPGLGNGNAFMDDNQNVTGQMWRLIPVGGGSQNNVQQQSVNEVVYQKGWSFSSPNHRFTIKFQEDGNLVLYKDEEIPIWVSNTSGRNVGRMVFQADGNLVIYNTNNAPIWASNSANRGGQTLELQNDGNFVIYTADRQAIWATNTNGR